MVAAGGSKAWTAQLIPVTPKLHLLVLVLFSNGASECIFCSQTNTFEIFSCVLLGSSWTILDLFVEVWLSPCVWVEWPFVSSEQCSRLASHLQDRYIPSFELASA